MESKISAVIHGNGRDLWVIVMGGYNNRFYKFLITPNGVSSPIIQDIGMVRKTPYYRVNQALQVKEINIFIILQMEDWKYLILKLGARVY